MSSVKLLARLMRLRALEEEQRRLEMQRVNSELAQIDNAIQRTEDRIVNARSHLRQGLLQEDVVLRIAGLIERDVANRIGGQLLQQRNARKKEFQARTSEFAAKRIERRQTEILLTQAEDIRRIEEARHAQISLDEWFNARRIMRSLAVNRDS